MELGVIIQLHNFEEGFKRLQELGFTTCQLNSFDVSIMTEDMTEKVKEASKKYGIRFCGLI